MSSNDGRPARFVWRGRLYTVLAVTRRPGAARSGGAGDERPSGGQWQSAADHDHQMRDWLCWRVTASPARNVPAVGFRLCQDPATGRWLLVRENA